MWIIIILGFHCSIFLVGYYNTLRPQKKLNFQDIIYGWCFLHHFPFHFVLGWYNGGLSATHLGIVSYFGNIMGLSSTSPTNLQKPIWWVCDQQKGLIKQSEMVILYHSTTKQHGFKCANDGISTGSNFKQWKAASPFLPMVVVWEGNASSALLVQTDCTQPAASLLLSIFSNHISHWGRNTWKNNA